MKGTPEKVHSRPFLICLPCKIYGHGSGLTEAWVNALLMDARLHCEIKFAVSSMNLVTF